VRFRSILIKNVPMPNITSKEKSHANNMYHAPKKCINNVLAFSKALHVETLSNGEKVNLNLN
jgi:hypothetical protein